MANLGKESKDVETIPFICIQPEESPGCACKLFWGTAGNRGRRREEEVGEVLMDTLQEEGAFWRDSWDQERGSAGLAL